MRLGLLLCCAALAGCPTGAEPGPDPTPAPFDAELADALQTVLHQSAFAIDAPGATATVHVPGEGTWAGATGFAHLDPGRPTEPDDRYRIGSITKPFNAAVVLQLVDEGALNLADPVTTWLPWLTGAEEITVEDLLRHSSGIVSYTDTALFVDALDEPWDPRDIVEHCWDLGPLFTPGAEYAYSNTNYYALALLVEAVTGAPWHTAIRQRLLDPLGLADTWVEGHEDDARGFVTPYLQGIDVTGRLDPSWHWASGGMIGTGADLVAWVDALVSGEVLPEALTAAMRTPWTLPSGDLAPYGYGWRIDATAACGAIEGHTGSTMGFQSDLVRREDGVVIAVLVNDFLSEASDITEALCAALNAR